MPLHLASDCLAEFPLSLPGSFAAWGSPEGLSASQTLVRSDINEDCYLINPLWLTKHFCKYGHSIQQQPSVEGNTPVGDRLREPGGM